MAHYHVHVQVRVIKYRKILHAHHQVDTNTTFIAMCIQGEGQMYDRHIYIYIYKVEWMVHVYTSTCTGTLLVR